MEDSLDSLSLLYKRVQKLIDDTSYNTEDSLDFLEGFVYALLIVQQDIKGTMYATKKKKED